MFFTFADQAGAILVCRNHERITNEAKALELVSEATTIPVPKLLEHGTHADGRRYLVTELVEGVSLNAFPRPCSKPRNEQHTTDQSLPCQACSDQAYSNAAEFIERTVLPQLASLKARSRGIDGFVMPPSWLSPVEVPWKGKTSWKTLPLQQPDYVFQHGDMAAHNLIMDPCTLQPRALIDWEFAGYFPAGMERWLGSLDPEAYLRRRNGRAHVIAEFLAEEFLECCDNWHDRDELDKLVRAGDLPNPDELKDARI